MAWLGGLAIVTCYVLVLSISNDGEEDDMTYLVASALLAIGYAFVAAGIILVLE
jgi:hypothetical protein